MSKKRAFTLVELLVVIAIIALLMSILMPALARVRNQAKSVLCQSNLKQLATAYSMYLGDYDGKFPQGWADGARNFHTEMWMEALRTYYGNSHDVRMCPMTVKTGTDIGQDAYGGWGTFIAWGKFEGDNCGDPWSWDSVTTCDYGSYGDNGYVNDPPPGVTQSQGSLTEWYWRRADVKGPTNNIPLILDCQWWGGWPRHDNLAPLWDGQPWDFDHEDMMRRFCINRHNGYVNGAFLDFSVRPVGLKELWKLQWHRAYDFDLTPTRAEFDNDAPWMRPFKYYD
ncbi:MAG: type II secretion system protein [Planctomycetota bacterium]|nr:MAG: type II secretion system protein [Planctomycetota bacterium]